VEKSKKEQLEDEIFDIKILIRDTQILKHKLNLSPSEIEESIKPLRELLMKKLKEKNVSNDDNGGW